MTLWNTLSQLFSSESKKYMAVFLAGNRTDTDDEISPMAAGEAYCRLWLVEMRLAKGVDVFTKRYPMVHAATRFSYGGQPVTIPYLAGPEYFQQYDARNVDKVIHGSQAISPLFPVASSKNTVKLQAGLFSMTADDPVRRFITTMGRFSKLLPVPELSTVIQQVGPIYSGIEDLLDIRDRRLELGYEYEFSIAGGGGSNTLRPGYFAIIRAEESQIDSDELCVVNDSLRLGPRGPEKEFLKQGNQALDGHSYMLFRLEARKEQDWESLTEIKLLVHQAQDAVFRHADKLVKDILLPAIQNAIYRSNDLTKHDKWQMVVKIEDELRQLGLHASSGEVPHSLYSIMQRSLPAVVPPETEERLADLERLFEM